MQYYQLVTPMYVASGQHGYDQEVNVQLFTQKESGKLWLEEFDPFFNLGQGTNMIWLQTRDTLGALTKFGVLNWVFHPMIIY